MSNIHAVIKRSRALLSQNESTKLTKSKLYTELAILADKYKANVESHRIATGALELLRGISDSNIKNTYRFLEESINKVLERIFTTSPKTIHLNESLRGGQHPQLTLYIREKTDAGIVEMSLDDDSGRGVAQVVSLLSLLSIITINNSRRIVLLDEVLSGVSGENLRVIDELLWAFAEIGFQFIINEHGYTPRGSHVYMLETKSLGNEITYDFIAEEGYYPDTNIRNRMTRDEMEQ